MKIKWALIVSLSAAILLFFGGLLSNYYSNYVFQSEVRSNAKGLARNLAIVVQTSNIPGLTPADAIELYVDGESSLGVTKYNLERAAMEAQRNNDIKISKNPPWLEEELATKLRSYARPLREKAKYEFSESAFFCFIALFTVLWFVPKVWYFFLARIRELSAAIRGV